MDMYHIAWLTDCRMAAHQHADLLNDVGTMGTVGMTAEALALWTCEEFKHTFRLTHYLNEMNNTGTIIQLFSWFKRR